MKREQILPEARPSTVRNAAASLLLVAGTSLIAALWFQPLSEQAVLAAFFGAVYLIVGIGLYGQSRFALTMGIILPAFLFGLVLNTRAPSEIIAYQAIRMGLELVIMVLCTLELWRVRHNPSV